MDVASNPPDANDEQRQPSILIVDDEPATLLKQAAKRRSVSEAELIRLAIDRQLGNGKLQPLPPDPLAWEQAHRFMMELRARGPIEGQTRTWERQSLYEERVSR